MIFMRLVLTVKSAVNPLLQLMIILQLFCEAQLLDQPPQHSSQLPLLK